MTELEQLQASAEQAAALLKAMSNPRRLLILCTLCGAPGTRAGDLARATGLAKTSAYRLAEQLVSLGAVQRSDHRYYLGARIGRLGRLWQPDPVMRRAAQAPCTPWPCGPARRRRCGSCTKISFV